MRGPSRCAHPLPACSSSCRLVSPRCPREMFNKGDQCFPRSPPALLPGAHSPRPTCSPGLIPMLGARGTQGTISPLRGASAGFERMKAEGPGVPVGLAGTAVNPIGRWHSARLRITCSQRLQISLTFPTGRRLWQPAGGPSQHFLSCPNELLLPNDTCSPGNSTALPPVQKSGLSLHGTLSCITRAPEFMLLCNRWWLEHQRG